MKIPTPRSMRETALFAGSIFDLRGLLCHRILANLEQRRNKMPQTAAEAMRRDWQAIGGDMRRALDTAKGARARG